MDPFVTGIADLTTRLQAVPYVLLAMVGMVMAVLYKRSRDQFW